MKKFVLSIFFVTMIAIGVFATETLTVYTYDSFISGMAKQIGPTFEKLYNCKVNFLSFGDAGNLLSRLVLEKSHPKADVVVGLSQSQIPRALSEGIFQSYKPSNVASVTDKSLLVDSKYRLIPFDYGALAIVYNREVMKNPPKSFEELLEPRFSHSLIVEDPRTSSTGLDFLLWTIGVYGNDWQNYWKKFMSTVKTVTSGWDAAFEMLEKGEAPMMISYATDEAYDYYYYKGSKLGVVIPSEGAYIEVEYAGILKGAKHLNLAKEFMNFVYSKEFQSAIPLNQWMYPVTKIPLPEVYKKYTPKITKMVIVDPQRIEKNLSKWLNEWSTLIIK